MPALIFHALLYVRVLSLACTDVLTRAVAITYHTSQAALICVYWRFCLAVMFSHDDDTSTSSVDMLVIGRILYDFEQFAAGCDL